MKILLLLCIGSFFMASCSINQEELKYINHLNYDKYNYVLYEHPSGFQELPYLVILKLKSDIDFEETKFPTHIKNSDWRSDIVLSLYAGKGLRFESSKILFKGLENEYILLQSNGMYFSIYSVNDQKSILHEEYPYGRWEKINLEKGDISNFLNWVNINIHQEILKLLGEY